MNLSHYIRDRGHLFWILHISGWSGYGLAAYAGALAHDKPMTYVAVIGVNIFAGFLLTTPLRYWFRFLWGRSPLVIGAGVMLGAYAIALIWRWISNTLYMRWVEMDWVPTSIWEYMSGTMSSFYVILCWSGLYFGIRYHQQLQKQTEQTLKATAAAHQAQLKMLRYQLNPHFLFNTLNAISTLILDNSNETANLAVSRLSDFLRYTLDNDPMKMVTLGSELQALDLYLEIEKVRFGDRLVVKKEIEEAGLNALVPSLILQPIIENAIKYAISPSTEGGTLTISARLHNGTLVLQLSDNGPGLGTGDGTKKSCGVGLKNTRERLQQFYGDQQDFTLAPNSPSGLVITINMPFETDEDNTNADR
jgi:two-component system LytT family sensor kinase